VRGVRCTDEGIRVVDTDSASGPGIRVSVDSSGICGSDLHLVSFGPSAVTLGHEFSGRLDDGTPVAVLPVLRCGRCAPCLAGREQQCPSALGSLYGISLDGGLADEVWVDPSCAKVLPDDLPLGHGCLVEPLAVALHGVHRAGVGPGARVAVIGGGPIGLCTIAAARSLGAGVDLVAHHTQRIEAGERLGAGTSAGTDYDVVLEAAGTQRSMDSAFELVRPGGTIGVVSTFWEQVGLGMGFQIKEVTLVPAFTYGHHHGVSEFDDAMRILAAAPDLPDAVITHHFALEDAAEAFRVAADRSTGAIKVVVHP
jgi:threonine dehydrogenase-like Zn-dependent dehydrogenase